MCRDITAKIHVNNLPHDDFGTGYMVVRRGEHDASLWYYGFYDYDCRDLAYEAAVEIGNGIVLETSEE